LLLHFGSEPACTALNSWLAAQACPELRFAPDTPTRDARGASELVMGEVRDACARLAALLSPKPGTAYLNHWRAANEAAWTLAAKRLDAEEEELSEPRAVATILQSLPAHTRLTLGNSMPVRTVDMVLPGQLAALEVLHQRGTSGIDGLIAGAIGSSDTSASALLLGDVSFNHDLASLALTPLCRGPLRIFVIDNQGGQIFSHLPVAHAELAKDSQALWRTPPRVDIQQVCAAFGVSYQKATTPASLAEALAWSQAQANCSVVQVCVGAESMLAFVQAMRGERRV
jgi:2-succinyl-5-enolpyruvyl-6-hydroxy-3-cyclohexene-1-carboxylate synthase